MCLQYNPFKNTMGKGEIARNEQFLLFPQCFLPVLRASCHFHQILNCPLQTLTVWKGLKFIIWVRVNSSRLSFIHVRNEDLENSLPQCTTVENNYMGTVEKGKKG